MRLDTYFINKQLLSKSLKAQVGSPYSKPKVSGRLRTRGSLGNLTSTRVTWLCHQYYGGWFCPVGRSFPAPSASIGWIWCYFPLKIFQVELSTHIFSHTSIIDQTARASSYQPIMARMIPLWAVMNLVTTDDCYFYGSTTSLGLRRRLA